MWDFFLTPKVSELGDEFEIINETTIGKSKKPTVANQCTVIRFSNTSRTLIDFFR